MLLLAGVLGGSAMQSGCAGRMPVGETDSHETPPSAVDERPRAVAAQPAACASSPLAGRGASSSIFTASAAIVPVAVVRGEILTTVDFPPASEKHPGTASRSRALVDADPLRAASTCRFPPGPSCSDSPPPATTRTARSSLSSERRACNCAGVPAALGWVTEKLRA